MKRKIPRGELIEKNTGLLGILWNRTKIFRYRSYVELQTWLEHKEKTDPKLIKKVRHRMSLLKSRDPGLDSAWYRMEEDKAKEQEKKSKKPAISKLKKVIEEGV